MLVLMTCSLRFKKDVAILKMLLSFGFCAFGFRNPFSCYLTSIVDKTHHGPVISPFSVLLLQLFEVHQGCSSK